MERGSLTGWTVDTLPSNFRAATNLLVSRLRYLFPLGMELTGESYEERNISLGAERKNYLMAMIQPLLWTYRSWRW